MFRAISWILYDIGIWVYGFMIRLSVVAVPKASLWVKGRKSLIQRIPVIPDDKKVIWIHCASLGEFEQGRPIIESLRSLDPGVFIILTFFSPSGYEVRKNYKQADIVTYIPLDSKKSAREFIGKIKPDLAIFVKYEFWFRHIQFLQSTHVPVVLVSALFRENQIFFQWYGQSFLQILRSYHKLYLQDKKSAEVLGHQGLSNFIVAGDTRIDRVIKLSKNAIEDKVLLEFNDGKLLILGSIWESDERVFLPFLRNPPKGWKFVIAPHEPDKYYVERYAAMFKGRLIRHSRFSRYDPAKHDILLIDSIGKLANAYQYGKMAYIGGAFGHGLHNILEPTAFQIPVAFGPKYDKFAEAVELVNRGGAFTISEPEQFEDWVQKYAESEGRIRVTNEQVLFLQEHSGATSRIIQDLAKENLI